MDEDLKKWMVDEIDEQTRKDILTGNGEIVHIPPRNIEYKFPEATGFYPIDEISQDIAFVDNTHIWKDKDTQMPKEDNYDTE